MQKKISQAIKENYFDFKFREYRANYIIQCFIIFACISVVLLLYGLFGGIIVGSIGASSFILFVTPHVNHSRARYVIGSYTCAGLVGIFFGSLYQGASISFAGSEVDIALILFCAAAVAVTTFIMVITNLEHPPAAALALGIVSGSDEVLTAAAALAGVIILCSVRATLRKYLINLI